MATQYTTVGLDKDLHADLRNYCAETGMKMKGVINKALVEFLANEVIRKYAKRAGKKVRRG